MESVGRSSSKTLSLEDGDVDMVVESQSSLGGVAVSRYPLRGLKSAKLESCSPGNVLGSSTKTLLNVESPSLTPSVDDVVRPRRGTKFVSNKSFNRVSFFAKNPLDLDRLFGYCAFSDEYSVFSPSADDRMWMPCRPSSHAIPDVYFEYGIRLPMHPFYFLFLKLSGVAWSN